MQPIERNIIIALIHELAAQGYQAAAVHCGGEYVMTGRDGRLASFCTVQEVMDEPSSVPNAPFNIVRAMTPDEALAAIDSADSSTLHFTHHNALTWGNRGIFFVLGNRGYDVITDHHCPIDKGEPFESTIDAVIARIDTGEFGMVQ